MEVPWGKHHLGGSIASLLEVNGAAADKLAESQSEVDIVIRKDVCEAAQV